MANPFLESSKPSTNPFRRGNRPLPTTAALARGARTRPLGSLASVALGAVRGLTGLEFSTRPGVPLAAATGRNLPALPTLTGPDPEAFEEATRTTAIAASVPVGIGLARGAVRLAGGLARRGAQAVQRTRSPAAEKLVQAIREAKPVRAEQEALFTAERSKRLAQAQAAARVPGEQGAKQFMGALRGELPKPAFAPVRPRFAQAEIDQLYDEIKNSPVLPGYSRAGAISGLNKLLHSTGVGVPQENELKLLSRVFGADFVREVQRGRSVLPGIIEVAGIPRALVSSLDLSAPLRQGLVAGVRYPRQFIRAFGDMFKMAAREEAFTAIKQNIVNRPTFSLMDEAGLALTGLDEGVLLAREEAFLSRLPERIPVLGKFIRGSNRAYTGFLMKLRADVFDELIKRTGKAGVPQTDELVRGIARFVNTATGRGDLGSWAQAGNALGTVLFSPRLLAARINMLNPAYYASLPPFVRKEALKSVVNLAAFGGTALTLASLAGAEVGKDPRSADFGKIKVGNTRVDIWGGFQQYPRIAAQMITGKLISTTTGREIQLGEGFRPLTRKDIAFRFFESKANPLVGTILELFEGRTFAGEKPTIPSTAKRLFVPLVMQDLFELAQEDPELLPLLGLGFFGAGVQTYGPPRSVPAKGRNPFRP